MSDDVLLHASRAPSIVIRHLCRIIRQDFVLKRSDFVKAWNNRFLVLTSTTLAWFDDPTHEVTFHFPVSDPDGFYSIFVGRYRVIEPRPPPPWKPAPGDLIRGVPLADVLGVQTTSSFRHVHSFNVLLKGHSDVKIAVATEDELFAWVSSIKAAVREVCAWVRSCFCSHQHRTTTHRQQTTTRLVLRPVVVQLNPRRCVGRAISSALQPKMCQQSRTLRWAIIGFEQASSGLSETRHKSRRNEQPRSASPLCTHYCQLVAIATRASDGSRTRRQASAHGMCSYVCTYVRMHVCMD
jgi:hypothetical protein